MMTVPIRPVASSTSRLIVTPAIMSRNSILPVLSVRIGTLYGSHCTNVSPFFTWAPSGFGNDRADHDIVALELAALGVVHADRAVLVQHDPASVERLHRAEIVELQSAVVLRLDDRLLERLARRAADVERPHRQLRARFADGLRGNDADRFAELHKLPGRQVASVALRADAAPAFASQHGANLQALDADLFDRRGDRLVDELIGLARPSSWSPDRPPSRS